MLQSQNVLFFCAMTVCSVEDPFHRMLPHHKLQTMPAAKTMSTAVSGSKAMGVKKIPKYWHRIRRHFRMDS